MTKKTMENEQKKPYDDPSNWEYDGGSENWTGDPNNLSPAMKEISDNLTKAAFPDGIEAFQKQRQKEQNERAANISGKSPIHEAIIFASRKHNGQYRKGTGIPYFSHIAEVMQILTANGCPEQVIIAGILHDTLEDTDTTPTEIEDLFGKAVLKLVTAESEDKSKTWKERKQATLDLLPRASREVKLVCCADKLSNLRSMAADLEIVGDKLWERFNARKDDIAWYYKGIVEALSELSTYQMYQELKLTFRVVFANISYTPKTSKKQQKKR